MKIIIYTLEVCPNCIQLKEALKELNIKYKEADMQSAESITEMRVGGCWAFEAPVLQVEDDFYETKDIFTDGKPNTERIKRLVGMS